MTVEVAGQEWCSFTKEDQPSTFIPMSPAALRNFSIFLVLLVLIDLYAYKGLNTALANHSLTLRITA